MIMKKFLFILMIWSTSGFCSELNAENVYQEIKDAGIKCPKIVLAQAVLETGWFKCKNCSLSGNNIFGFYYKGTYLKFDTWEESVQYYSRWQIRKGYKGGDYYKFLKNVGYASDPEYSNKLKSIIKRLSYL